MSLLDKSPPPSNGAGQRYEGSALASHAVTTFGAALEAHWEQVERTLGSLNAMAGIGPEVLRTVRDLRTARAAFAIGQLITARHQVQVLYERWQILDRAAKSPGAKRVQSVLAGLAADMAHPLAGAAILTRDDQAANLTNLCADLRVAIKSMRTTTTVPGSGFGGGAQPTTMVVKPLSQHQMDLLEGLGALEDQINKCRPPIPLRFLRQMGLLAAILASTEAESRHWLESQPDEDLSLDTDV